MDRDINNLVPEAVTSYLLWKNACAERGLIVRETCVSRLLIVQVAFYAQGRESYREICKLREHAKLWKISEEEAKKVITWTFLSNHIPEFCFPRRDKNFGKVLAVDFALEDLEGNLHWSGKADVNSNNESDYKEAGLLAEEFGFKSGWHWGDKPHIQWMMK